jgi:deoxyribodipyrimidine photolyase-related protein
MEASIIYPHQLFKEHPVLKTGRVVYLVEEPLLLTHNPAHTQKLLLHRLAMQSYQELLLEQGYTVVYLEISTLASSAAVFERLQKDGMTILHIADTTDMYLERAIAAAVKTFGLDCRRYESPLFILSRAEAENYYVQSKRFMASFYKNIRQAKNILMDEGKPRGGKYSFDAENRKRLPNKITLPDDIACFENADTTKALAWIKTFESERYGDTQCWIPYTHEAAEKFLEEFLRLRLTAFGDYEDAITTTHTRLWHSTLSPLINIGLLTPMQVLSAALTYAEAHDVPLNSLEGFVRQILGWREFIRASYEVDGVKMRNGNFFNHHRPLSSSLWDGTTNVSPVDHTIKTALDFGYTHHIERLMVMGNFLLLTQTDPHEVYRWFMGMYVDAYDWVMVPNVYGMSQFADGGLFATKPYISGASYLKKMSDYPKGDWEDVWTALYWNFINTHKEFFTKNHRLSMMPKLLEKMAPETRENHLTLAKKYLN